jgi:hypothetical protein
VDDDGVVVNRLDVRVSWVSGVLLLLLIGVLGAWAEDGLGAWPVAVLGDIHRAPGFRRRELVEALVVLALVLKPGSCSIPPLLERAAGVT